MTHTVAVTGSEGFIGSHLVKRFKACGWNIQAVDTHIGWNIVTMGEWPYANAPDVIVHAAARADISGNWAPGGRDAVYSDNVLATWSLLEMTRGIPMVFLSSGCVYGDPKTWPAVQATEDMQVHATSPYAASKVAGEAFMQAWLPDKYHILRLAGVVGEGYHHGHIADFARGKRPLSNGRQSASYVHVEDVASAVEACILGVIPPGTFNVASGTWSARDTARVMGLTLDWPEEASGWAGDYPFTLSSRRLRSFGWISKRSVEAGVREALGGMGWNR